MPSDQVTSALIAGGVSLLVGVATFSSVLFTLRAKVKEYERQIANKYQERLYEKRLELYPRAFALTRGINFPPKDWKSFERVEMLNRRDELVDWINSQAGLVISQPVIGVSRDLIRALSPNYGDPDGYQRAQMENIINAAVAFRRELRRDILLFHKHDLSRDASDA
jgi:hypothetical protein